MARGTRLLLVLAAACGALLPLSFDPARVTPRVADAYAGAEEFDVFQVKVNVIRRMGGVVPDAIVKVYSDDWNWQSPHDPYAWATTDQNGQVSFTLTRGLWTFVAAGNYVFSDRHPGRSFYVHKSLVLVESDMEIWLHAYTYIFCDFRDRNGDPLHVEELRATVPDLAPGYASAVCGSALNGATIVETTEDTGPVLFSAIHRDIESEDAYYLQGRAEADGALNLRAWPDSVAALHFSSFGEAGDAHDGNVEFRPLDYDSWLVWDINTVPTRTLYTNFRNARIDYRFLDVPGASYSFVGDFVHLPAKLDTSIAFGGVMNAFLHVIPRCDPSFGEHTQLWLQVMDAHGHDLARPPTGDPIPFTVYEHGQQTWHGEFTSYFSSIPRWFPLGPDTTTFSCEVPLAGFGTPVVAGPLFTRATNYDDSGVASEHFDFHAPAAYEARSLRLLPFLESYYAALEPLAWGAIADTVQYVVDVTGQGFPNEVVPCRVPLAVHQQTDPLDPRSMFFAGHEMGHVRLFHPSCGRRLDVPFQEYGESYATLLCLAGYEGLVDPNVLRAEAGSHDLFFRHLTHGDPVADVPDRTETLQFVEEYIRHFYGWDPHRDMMFRYAEEMTGEREWLYAHGFSEWETIAVLYSHQAGSNLGWLWDLAGLGVTENRVGQGLVVLSVLAVPEGASPRALWLAAARPNPSLGRAEVEFVLPRDGAVRLAVYDLAGKRVATLVDGQRPAGRHTVRWDARAGSGARLASGVYFMKLEAAGETRTRKLVLTR